MCALVCVCLSACQSVRVHVCVFVSVFVGVFVGVFVDVFVLCHPSFTPHMCSLQVEEIARLHDPRLAVDCTRAYHFGARCEQPLPVPFSRSALSLPHITVSLAFVYVSKPSLSLISLTSWPDEVDITICALSVMMTRHVSTRLYVLILEKHSQ